MKTSGTQYSCMWVPVFLSPQYSWMMGLIFPEITWTTTYIPYFLLRAQVTDTQWDLEEGDKVI